MDPIESFKAQVEAKAASAEAFLTPYREFRSTISRELLCAKIRPTDADCAIAFRAPHAHRAVEGYAAFYADHPIPANNNPAQTEIAVTVAPALVLHSKGMPVYRAFPGAYLKVAPFLNPSVWWAVWKYTRKGQATGMSYDGLAEVAPGRWVWFPKPWRVLLQPESGA